ncbi:MAG: hypothetical protein ACLP50_10120, partial [Solirubrobacteraceae bacterium]
RGNLTGSRTSFLWAVTCEGRAGPGRLGGVSERPTAGTDTAAGNLTRGPVLDLRTQPKLDPAAPEVDDWARHVLVSALIQADAVAVGQAKEFGDSLGVE